jgi:hypothetical protein
MNIKLVTFADGSISLRNAGQRLTRQADSTGFFTLTSSHWTKKDIAEFLPGFFLSEKVFMDENQKGMGYWIWKPAIFEYELSKLDSGDVIVMLDAGCQLNITPNSKKRFDFYVQMAVRHGLVLMQIQDNSFGFNNFHEEAWTKAETLSALDPEMRFKNTNQYQAGIIFASKSGDTLKLAQDWLELCSVDNHRLLMPPELNDHQCDLFIDHRHDQSILSLLAKKANCYSILDETYFFPDWNEGSDFPIWAMRNRTGADIHRRNFGDLIHLTFSRAERFIRKYLK